mgnify:CR=1 FL=1
MFICADCGADKLVNAIRTNVITRTCIFEVELFRVEWRGVVTTCWVQAEDVNETLEATALVNYAAESLSMQHENWFCFNGSIATQCRSRPGPCRPSGLVALPLGRRPTYLWLPPSQNAEVIPITCRAVRPAARSS